MATPPPTSRSSNAAKLVAIAVAVAVVAGGIFLLSRDDGDDTASRAAPTTSTSSGTVDASVAALPPEGRVPVELGDGLIFRMGSEPEETEVVAETATSAPVSGRKWSAAVPGSDDREFVILYELDDEPLDLELELEQAVRDEGAAVLGPVGSSTYYSLDGPSITGTIYETGIDGSIRAMAIRLPYRIVIFGYTSEGGDPAAAERGFDAFARSVSGNR
jgi:hypothetical protein